MKLDLEFISDFLVNRWENMSSIEDAIDLIIDESKDLELKQRVTTMLTLWGNSESLKYFLNKDHLLAEKLLRSFIKKNLGPYL